MSSYRIDRAHPLLRSAISAQIFSTPGRFEDEIKNSFPSVTGSNRSFLRRSWQIPTNGYFYFAPPYARSALGSAFTSILLYRYIAKTGVASDFIFGDVRYASGNEYNWGHYYANSTNEAGFYVTTTGAASAFPSYTWKAGKLVASIGAYDGANVKMWIDGAYAQTAQTGTVATGSTEHALAANRWGNSNSQIAGEYFYHILFNRCISHGEAQAWTANPWQIFERNVFRTYSIPYAAPVQSSSRRRYIFIN